MIKTILYLSLFFLVPYIEARDSRPTDSLDCIELRGCGRRDRV
jgi:hypothetical protein